MSCDVIIPVYNSPEWVVVCVREVFRQTPPEYINSVILVDDASQPYTQSVLKELEAQYAKCTVLTSSENKGFIHTVNTGLRHAVAPYRLLLNSDCFITKNTIPKLISHIEKSKDKVGLISPFSNNSPDITMPMLIGYSYFQMNALMEEHFSGKSFNACTIVGNCLMITKECYDAVGDMDTIYGKGYGEETEYQFQAYKKGFEAKIAIDTYVYHKMGVSFGDSPSANQARRKNWELFMSRWKKQYDKRKRKYDRNDPVKYCKKKLKLYFKNQPRNKEYDVLFFLPGISQAVGGAHVVVDIVNTLIMNGIHAGIVTLGESEYQEMKFFRDLNLGSELGFTYKSKIKAKAVVSTLWNTAYTAYLYSVVHDIPLIDFVQGQETYFYNGTLYSKIEESYAMADDVIVISQWLHDVMKEKHGLKSTILPNSIDRHIFHVTNNNKMIDGKVRVLIVHRGSVEKGDWIAQDCIRLLLNKYSDSVNITVIARNNLYLPQHTENVTLIEGPLSRSKIAEMLNNTDIYIDASLKEGFGLLPLEAMACGAVPVCSDSGGINEFITDETNGLIVTDVNKSESYIEKIDRLINDKEYYMQLREQAIATGRIYSDEQRRQAYVDYFKNVGNIQKKSKKNMEYFAKYLIAQYQLTYGLKNIKYKADLFLTNHLSIPMRLIHFIKKVAMRLRLL